MKDRTTTLFHQRVRRDDGATAIEYGLIGGLIAVPIIIAATLLWTDLSWLFTGVAGDIAAPAWPGKSGTTPLSWPTKGGLTAIDLDFLPNRRDALQNLAKRIDTASIR